jgi:hypothetical protein
MVLVEVFIVGGHKKNAQRISWQKERYRGFWGCILLRSYLELDFRKQLKMSVPIFKHLCTILELVLKKEDTKMRASISVEYEIAIILSCLRTGNTLMMVGDLYELSLSTTPEIVRECCKAIRIHLKPLVIKRPTLVQMK